MSLLILSRGRPASLPGQTDPYVGYTTFYAAADASGGGDGSLGNPWTLAEAFANATSGQRVLFRGGTYPIDGSGKAFDEPAIEPTNNGGNGPDNFIVFQNYPDETPVFRIDAGDSGAYGSKGNGHVFRGLDIQGNHAGVGVGMMFYGATNGRIEHVTFSGIVGSSGGGDPNNACVRIREGGETGNIYVGNCHMDGPAQTGNNQANVLVYSTWNVTVEYSYGTGSGTFVYFKGQEAINIGMVNGLVYRNHCDSNEWFVQWVSLNDDADNRQILENLAFVNQFCFKTSEMQLQSGTAATNQIINRNTLVCDAGAIGDDGGIMNLKMNSSSEGKFGSGFQMRLNIMAMKDEGEAFIGVHNSGTGNGQLPSDADIDDNCYHNNVSFRMTEAGTAFDSLSAWQSGASVAGTDANSDYQDCGFNDFANDDFTGPTDRGAFSNGFDLADVGPNPYTEIP